MLGMPRRAATLAAIPAALAIGFAVPASASPAGVQAVVGAAYPSVNRGGAPVDLDKHQTCTSIDLSPGALSAENYPDSGSTITLYPTASCIPATGVTITEGQSLLIFFAVAYSST